MEITVKDMTDDSVASEAKGLGINSVPAIVIDGRLTDCCITGGSDRDALNAAGIIETQRPEVLELKQFCELSLIHS